MNYLSRSTFYRHQEWFVVLKAIILRTHANHSPTSRADVKNEWSFTCSPYIPSWNWQEQLPEISGFRDDVNEICAILLFYSAWRGISIPTFRDNQPFPSLYMGPTGCPKRRYESTTLRWVKSQNAADLRNNFTFVRMNSKSLLRFRDKGKRSKNRVTHRRLLRYNAVWPHTYTS